VDLTGGRGVTRALEAAGSSATAEMAFDKMRRRGTATIIGLIPEGQKMSVPGDVLY